MGLILDTSAVIGWVELQDANLVQWLLENADESTPSIHAVTLGELERGVLEARDSATRARRAETLSFARDELGVVSFHDTVEQAHLFGVVSSAVSRKVSHNDCWITAAALGANDTLATMDKRLTEQLHVAVRAENHLTRWLDARQHKLEIRHFSRGPAG